MSEVNVPLLRKAVEWAEAEWAKGTDEDGRLVGDWYQGEWVVTAEERDGYETLAASCDTAYCIAGYVGVLALGPDAFDRSWWFDEDEGVTHVSEVAQRALGLTTFEADALFKGSNTIEDVRRIAEGIAGEPL